MDIKSYLKNEQNKPKENCGEQYIEKDVEKNTRRYSGMNEGQLMQEMFRVAGENRKNGQLDGAKLEEFYGKAAPMLTVPQRNKLRPLINSLK